MRIKNDYTLIRGDCLDVLPTLDPCSIDAVITDFPYGVTQCQWDSVVPLAPMWERLQPLLSSSNAPIVLFASQPFTSSLVMSNPAAYHHSWIWEKSHATGHLNAKKQPMRKHEDILVFSYGVPNYYPQITAKPLKNVRKSSGGNKTSVYGSFKPTSDGVNRTISEGEQYPKTILKYNNVPPKQRIHDTQKPLDLIEYLVKTYSLPGDTILDMTMGSATTGIAAMKMGRRFVGIEMDQNIFDTAKHRMLNFCGQFALSPEEKVSGKLSLFGW